MSGTADVFREVFCARCGRVFIPAPEHVFHEISRNKHLYYCKPTCWLHRNDSESASKGRPGKKVIQSRKDGVAIRVFKSPSQASEFVLADAKKIREACRTGAICAGFLWRYADDV